MERLVTLHDASTIAAMIIEPVAGSTNAVKWLRTRLIRYQAAFSS
jgi:adenosylmethionine-8-amino-7-oxononanoate aminotransferase